jgi:hypothetical protein
MLDIKKLSIKDSATDKYGTEFRAGSIVCDAT